MGKRSYSGGTTALIIVLTLVVIIVGVCFFFWMKIIGGSNELQHATDSGNLNVAKQVLKAPSVAFANSDEANEFGDLTDPTSTPPNQVDLLVYDRLVAKAIVVALNAQAENTPLAISHAQNCAQMVQSNTYTLSDGTTGQGIGLRLANQLANNSNLSTFFTALSQANTTRMLQSTNAVTSNATETQVSYMARGKASNVYLNYDQLPGSTAFVNGKSNSNIVTKTIGSGASAVTKQYLAGYSPLSAGAGVTIQAVPMRPGEQPHLVDLGDFQQLTSAPVTQGSTALIPPNAFRSGGDSAEQNQTGANLTMRSGAIIGTVLSTLGGTQQDFPVSLPRGYIIVDNTGTQNLYGNYVASSQTYQNFGGGGSSVDMMLQPSLGIDLITTPSGPVFGPKGSLAPVVADANNPNVTPTQFNNDLSKVQQQTAAGSPPSIGPLSQSQAISDFQSSSPPTPIVCNMDNTLGSSPNPDCAAAYSDFAAAYNIPAGTGSSLTANGLSAVEQFKCAVLAARASVGDSGCQSVPTAAVTTGLKQYDMSAVQGGCPTNADQPCNVYSSGTLASVLGITNGGTALIQQGTATKKSNPNGELTTRLNQIVPGGDLSGVLNSNVPFGQISYIYSSGGANPTLTLSTTPPSFPIIPTLRPDGQPLPNNNTSLPIAPFIGPTSNGSSYSNPVCPAPMVCYSQIGSLDSTVFNLQECEGYPHPWDCSDGGTGAWGMNSAQWTPSSGYNNLLGVLRLFNWAAVGGNWCCPC